MRSIVVVVLALVAIAVVPGSASAVTRDEAAQATYLFLAPLVSEGEYARVPKCSKRPRSYVCWLELSIRNEETDIAAAVTGAVRVTGKSCRRVKVRRGQKRPRIVIYNLCDSSKPRVVSSTK